MKMAHDQFTAYESEIEALVTRFDLVAEPVSLHVRGMNGGLDYPCPSGDYDCNGLEFGTLYRVKQAFSPNASSEVGLGLQAYFLGYYIFPYESALRLHMELPNGTRFEIEFHGSGPCQAGEISGMSDPLQFFEAIKPSESTRAEALAEARQSILDLSQKAANERAVQAELDRPAWDKRTEAAVNTFALPDLVSYGYVTGTGGMLDVAHLTFGHSYIVTQTIASNRGGKLVKGDKLRFLGAYEGDDQSLGLFFETRHAKPLDLWFQPNAPQKPDTRRYFRNPAAHLRPTLWDFSKRRKRLTAARAVLLHLRKSYEA